VSSQTVKEVAFFGGDVKGVVPDAVVSRLVAPRATQSDDKER
jgi:phosphopantetheine adenylyltransferase